MPIVVQLAPAHYCTLKGCARANCMLAVLATKLCIMCNRFLCGSFLAGARHKHPFISAHRADWPSVACYVSFVSSSPLCSAKTSKTKHYEENLYKRGHSVTPSAKARPRARACALGRLTALYAPRLFLLSCYLLEISHALGEKLGEKKYKIL